ncbi:hypothetical protein EYZ11_006312 [Aspergillus tanneri]|uniref:Uncharacterized protein n=1 Tax=Aspergillus tanneri TaxID=1220188 RepID=A0A4S3JFU0_9EURO|nr:uncharacterized protein ATNIH1004_004798 [Aspergillus tanneri]KAA8648911.1 hypothetical protein ATNIH1004_004798 [Aspergillus tanneri]THC94213.1 hypothetical protein EYZ11_006312 [Aspergillus tanneri]
MLVNTVIGSPEITTKATKFAKKFSEHTDEEEGISNESFYTATQAIIHFYLDQGLGPTTPGTTHEIFVQLSRKDEGHFMRDLNASDPDEIIPVTEYRREIADFISTIVENGFGYVRARSDGVLMGG